jgi:hypothetical protein
MWTGVQFRGTLAANATQRWFTQSWPEAWHVVWYIVPTTPRAGASQIDWDVEVERASGTHVTYWLTVKNATNFPVDIEARFAVLN